MAPYDIPIGSSYASVIVKAIKKSSKMLLLLSDNSIKSLWVEKELDRSITYMGNNHIHPLKTSRFHGIYQNESFELYLCNIQIPDINVDKLKIEELDALLVKLFGRVLKR